jgi:hypothetical protein
MIAYFLLVNRYPTKLKRLFNAIYEPSNHYVVHVDKGSRAELAQEVADFLDPYRSPDRAPGPIARFHTAELAAA